MKIGPMEFILLALATYRLALMVSTEAGPFWMFKLLRRKVKRNAPKVTHMDEGIDCLWCVSMQFGVVVAVSAWFLWEFVTFRILISALAFSAVAVILHSRFTK